MNGQEQYEMHKDYIQSNGLDRVIDFQENIDHKDSVFDAVSGKIKIPFPPKADDLVRLHKLIRHRRPFTIIEFGLGYSTVIMADASSEWIQNVKGRFPAHLLSRVHFQHSNVEIGTFNGQLCHYYKHLPDVIAEF
ncbi:hypothetical protein SAMN05216339_102363 [Nitrosomonas eutropha]|uniref:Uncharacterized protein n=1 Tax=Nitrosomonas eutropha TaxID=916 RepID=A0A1I7GC64_9PROT|nr:hypothetical protein [Nitrosomonas eutropha]SFU46049.1 hypothetical protein SAMN05216339_102363 [Nitrosomonas eutropha]